MKLWTYAEARDKLLGDNDLQDQSFISPSELIGYFNEGIEDVESEILKIDEDYFLTSFYLPMVAGTSAYDYPYNIYGFKLRGLQYAVSTIVYPVHKFRRRNKFDNIAYANLNNAADDYRWYPTNDVTGAKINLVPAARETAVVPPLASSFTPITGWYIRHANRIPILGEYIPRYELVVQSTGINIGTDVITVQSTYVTGDKVKLSSTGTMPTGLVSGTAYFAIASGSTLKLATTLQNAQLGTAIDITAVGSGTLYISIAANQTIIDNTVIDVPEAVRYVMQFSKCRCFEKEGDPRLDGAAALLQKFKDQLISSLTEAQPDDENMVEADTSNYEEMS